MAKKKENNNPIMGGQTMDGVKFDDTHKNFVCRQNPDGSFDNGSYNRVWKVEGYSGAINCMKVLEILIEYESQK